MKVKLKKGQRLSSMDNYSGLCYKDWLALEQGEIVELDKINNFINIFLKWKSNHHFPLRIRRN